MPSSTVVENEQYYVNLKCIFFFFNVDIFYMFNDRQKVNCCLKLVLKTDIVSSIHILMETRTETKQNNDGPSRI